MATQKKSTLKLVSPVFNMSGKEVGSLSLSEAVFGAEIVPQLVAQAVKVYLTNQRLGTKGTKTRSTVAGSTKKIYKQKGTGRARHGSLKAPIFIGGGVAHGPHPKDYSLDFPLKMRKAALCSALSDAFQSGKIKIVEGFESMPAKTKELVKVFGNLKIERKTKNILLIVSDNSKNLVLAGRNIPYVTVRNAHLLHAYDIMVHPTLLFHKDAIGIVNNMNSEKKEVKKEVTEKIEVKSTVSVEKNAKKAPAKVEVKNKAVTKAKPKKVTQKKK